MSRGGKKKKYRCFLPGFTGSAEEKRDWLCNFLFKLGGSEKGEKEREKEGEDTLSSLMPESSRKNRREDGKKKLKPTSMLLSS